MTFFVTILQNLIGQPSEIERRGLSVDYILHKLNVLTMANLADERKLTQLQMAELFMFLEDIKYPSIFRATVIKRTNGEIRTFNCRLGVKKFEKGGSMTYDPREKKLVTVCDLDLVKEGKNPYRNINLDAIIEATIEGETFTNIEVAAHANHD